MAIWLPRVAIFSLLALLLGLSITSKQFLANDNNYPIHHVQIYGVRHLDRLQIQLLLLPLVSHGFFTLNLPLIRDRVQQFSWVENVNIKRSWPDTIKIMIYERSALALWNNNSLLSSTGKIFFADDMSTSKDLPEFIGPNDASNTMLAVFNKFSALLSTQQLHIQQLRMSPDELYQLTLSNGIILKLGHSNILAHLKRFLRFYPQLKKQQAAIEYIDLRYNNGMAIKWKH
jgi:cell division protein FtsQ